MFSATSLNGAVCDLDYVVIPGGTATDVLGAITPADRFCGSLFPVTVECKFNNVVQTIVKINVNNALNYIIYHYSV